MVVLLLDFVFEGGDVARELVVWREGRFLSRGCLSWCVFGRERERSMSGIMID